ncbi:MAG: SDR family NAD(P)-dependent oxidoreductase [Alphaproteobacteria bacterium]
MLENKVILVTGGGRGIGLGITNTLLKYNAKVIVAQRNNVPAELEGKVDFVKADFSDTNSPATVAEYISANYDHIDGIVNNAGIMWEKHLEDMTQQDYDQMMQINTSTPIFLTKALLPLLKKSKAGSVVNIGSIEGIQSNPEHIAYGTSKGAVHSATINMADDLGKFNIRVNSIAPGWITSDLAENYINSQQDPEAALQALIKLHPVGRVGQPEDIGGVVAFLMNEDLSAFVTAQIIVVDGGRTSKIPLF